MSLLASESNATIRCGLFCTALHISNDTYSNLPSKDVVSSVCVVSNKYREASNFQGFDCRIEAVELLKDRSLWVSARDEANDLNIANLEKMINNDNTHPSLIFADNEWDK